MRAVDFPPGDMSRVSSASSPGSVANPASANSASSEASVSTASATRARAAPPRTTSPDDRSPSTNASAPSNIVLPEPVSPVQTVKPSANSSEARAISPKSSISKRESRTVT